LPAGAHHAYGKTATAQQRGDRLGRSLDLGMIEAVEGDARDADEAFQVGSDAGKLPFHGGPEGIHSRRIPGGRKLCGGRAVK
jgi:hypothetical protein